MGISDYIAIGAFIISIFGFFFSFFSFRTNLISARKEELRSILEKMVRNRENFASVFIKELNYEIRKEKSKASGTIRNMYLQASENLIEKIGKYVTSSQYLILAKEYKIFGDYENYLKMLRKAVKVAKRESTPHMVLAYRALAVSCFNIPDNKKLIEGRKIFQNTLNLTKSKTDDRFKSLHFTTIHSWVLSEIRNGDIETAINQNLILENHLETIDFIDNAKFDKIKDVAENWFMIAKTIFKEIEVTEITNYSVYLNKSNELLSKLHDDEAIEKIGNNYYRLLKTPKITSDYSFKKELAENALRYFMAIPNENSQLKAKIRDLNKFINQE